MAITSAIVKKMRWGRLRVHFGTYLDTGAGIADDIDTGLRLCHIFFTWEKKNAAPAEGAGVNEDFSSGPIDGSLVNMIASAMNMTGYWLAFGL